jgi:murein DD-endopeptidase MepM/ murein hydrolase activator NlpD
VHYIVLFLVALLLTTGIGYLGYTLGETPDRGLNISKWKESLHQQSLELDSIRQESDASVEALASRLGLLQAHVNRIDALGQKLIHMAKIDKGEFDFDQTPALGGPESASQSTQNSSEIHKALDQLAASLKNRENQLIVLEDLLLSSNILKEVQPSGRPIKKGWLSSYFGMRNHPISGKKEMHKGIDFAGKEGGAVIAVAKGVITFSGNRWGYGQVIDINHGNGYTTRYGHNSRLLVSVGDTVEKGFQIAEIGSSGRSTGPHVHFEVLQNGRQVNPMKFINASN